MTNLSKDKPKGYSFGTAFPFFEQATDTNYEVVFLLKLNVIYFLGYKSRMGKDNFIPYKSDSPGDFPRNRFLDRYHAFTANEWWTFRLWLALGRPWPLCKILTGLMGYPTLHNFDVELESAWTDFRFRKLFNVRLWIMVLMCYINYVAFVVLFSFKWLVNNSLRFLSEKSRFFSPFRFFDPVVLFVQYYVHLEVCLWICWNVLPLICV